MGTITINLYQFDELTDKAKEKALEHCRYFGVEHQWYGAIYEDAKNIGCRIEGFDLGRANDLHLHMDDDHIEIANAIVENHRETCKTYELATKFKKDFATVTEDDLDDLEQSFKESLAGEYLQMLHRDYEYLTSDKAVKEMIEVNEYEFHQDGKFA